MYLLGFDIGSSSIKAAIVEVASGKSLGVIRSPEVEMEIMALQEGWAEQDPELWWRHLCKASKSLLHKTNVDPSQIKGIGISYQMHGLVVVDKNHEALRPSIIWCDSRAVDLGNEAFEAIGEQVCLSHCLNSPGNFTASKLKWVRDNEPTIYNKIDKVLLPGDFVAMKMTGELSTTMSGLSEGVMWDFKNNTLAKPVFDHYGISDTLIPQVMETFSPQGKLTGSAADEMGLISGIPISYRAGDQPNNAMSLGVFQPNEVAATGGTSGVIYGILDNYNYDPGSRVNGFAHVNHSAAQPRIGQLLCINGAGILYSWMKKQIADTGIGYTELEELVQKVPIGADGLRIIPFGNGAERVINNKSTGAQINNLQFNRHTQSHLFRASLEGIAFSFVYGFEILKKLGLDPKVIKVGNDNLFQSEVFSQTLCALIGCNIEVVNTTGAIGAAKASGVGVGIYKNLEEAFSGNSVEQVFRPSDTGDAYRQAYADWERDLERLIS